MASVREAVLDAARSMEARGHVPWTPADMRRELAALGHRLNDDTVNTHVGSYMCADAPQNHGVQHADLRRVGRGLYRLAGL